MEKIHSLQAMSYLEEGHTLIHTNDRTIIKLKEKRIILHHEKWHSSLDIHAFFELYKDSYFWVYEKEEQGIDEKKDEEYYQWASHYQ